MKKTLLIAIAIAAISGAYYAISRPTAPDTAIRNEAQAIERATAALTKHRLTRLDNRCLLFLPETSADGYYINVHEKHDAKCGGDPATAPRLFGLGIAGKTGTVTLDDPVSGETRVLD